MCAFLSAVGCECRSPRVLSAWVRKPCLCPSMVPHSAQRAQPASSQATVGGLALGPAGHEGAPRYRSPDALAGAAWGRLMGRCRTLSCGLWGRRAPPGGEPRPGTLSKLPGAGAGGKVEFTVCDPSLLRESLGPFGDRRKAAKEVCAAGPGSERSVDTCPRAATGGNAARLGWLTALRAP